MTKIHQILQEKPETRQRAKSALKKVYEQNPRILYKSEKWYIIKTKSKQSKIY